MSHIRVQLSDERGKLLGQGVDLWSPFFDDFANAKYRLLPYIDRYGNTIFNKLQIPDLLVDLHKLKADKGPDDQAIIAQLGSLCEECLADVHLYLRFIGD